MYNTAAGNSTSYFENGQLPQLLYVTKQHWTTDLMPRPIHGHDGISEILVVYHGSGQYIIDHQTFAVSVGDVLFYSSGQLHEVAPFHDTEIGVYGFGIGSLRLSGLLPGQILPPHTTHIRHSADQSSTILALCELIYAKMSESLPGDNELCNHLTAALIIAATQLPDPTSHSFKRSDYVLVSSIKQHIDQNYADNITLASISKALNISPYYASHIFKQVMGYSPIQYVIRRRIGEAQSLLIGSNHSATQIATMVGYDNTNYFNTIFTKMVGISPIRYRKRFLENMKGKRIH